MEDFGLRSDRRRVCMPVFIQWKEVSSLEVTAKHVQSTWYPSHQKFARLIYEGKILSSTLCLNMLHEFIFPYMLLHLERFPRWKIFNFYLSVVNAK